MAKEKPINAEVPEEKSLKERPESSSSDQQETQSPQKPKQRRPVPLPLKLVVGAVIVAAVFIVVAILGGGSDSEESPGPISKSSDTPSQASHPSAQASEELGYPAFATSNTTRVGGADPASNASGVALATFPSTDDAQRPAAVVLVDESDWAAAIAASVLVADPVSAPILIADGDELPEPTAQALEALEPQGSKATKGAQAFAIGGASPPGGLETTRVQGGGPASVAAKIAQLRDRLFDSPPANLLVVPAGNPTFAMPAAAWAARSGDPILLSGRAELPKPTVAVLKRHPKARVFVLGPPSAISSKALRQIAAINERVRRVSGEDPVSNSIAFARYDDGGFGWNINDPGHGFVVARDDEPLNAAAAAPLSASGTWGPLLLSDDADTLPQALRGYFLDVKPGYTDDPTRAFYNHVWVIGDQEAIDVRQQGEIDELAELARIGR